MDNKMKPQEFFYTCDPIMKKVTKQEFIDFINSYPRKLERDVFGACDPPSVTYNDFELANRWPYSVIASTMLYSDKPDDYWYAPEEERTYNIMINYQEVFLSKTGNQVEDN